ncbi:LysM peptidoglycan-binding domain-containing protein [Mucilaginibacter agri]|uniref:LysM peptidoglycan-binding domain-containing protein n=1 Tax=Mucilaginibacter agri TaxID=2695265 RepID=A0A965ZIR9_9SPHI|nr:LysM peptidoglycan-binding domain-containing protein [Mucilaginibacter agri]NCD71884.1 LysM peptidoglycan-binding domain-containing protein [Mucilaginibacter agri]
MRFRILLLVIAFSATSAKLLANPLVDSVGVENQNGKKVILHKVEVKETYYGIARKYNVKPQVLIKFNTNATLHIGDIVKVPTDIPFAQQAAPVAAAPAVQTQQPAANSAETGAIVQYKVAQHEYLYGIARRFNTTAEEIKKLNNLQSSTLTPGQLLNIRQGAGTTIQTQPQTTAPAPTQPVVQPAPVAAAPVQAPAQQPAANTGETGTIIQYKVAKHEYLYSVAKRFNSTVEDIKQRNNLKSNSLTPGMVLNILQGASSATAAAPQGVVVQEKPPVTDTIPPAKRDSNLAGIADSANVEHHSPSKYGLFEKNEKGVATTLDDPTLDQNKKLILHRTAPIGTVIKITNPMTNRTTFAKVVGSFTDNESTKDVIIVMTKSVAESLGALDKRFHVNISYGVSNE